MKRTIAFKAVVGSENYNLVTKESDKDYKTFVIPTFADLYDRTIYTDSMVKQTIDEEIHDVRKLPTLWWKSNVNFLEVLFAREIIINDNSLVKRAVNELLARKQDIATMNLPYLYKACQGMYLSKYKYLEKGNKSTNHLVEEFGYDTKSAMHAYRILDFVERFSSNHFRNFQEAMTYNDNDREFMVAIKKGRYTKDEVKQLIDEKLSACEKLKNVYLSQPVNEQTKSIVETIIYELTVDCIKGELQ
ncbi:nucleotidyltransferase domain-containing protein [Alkalihalobacillus sp. MEB130]|uniref:DNA polymerase beta superfamily protein n=1 Tax=Alkalihalobacillus sp. MEB130 TaxID=2976704 RepID=UPI0028DE1FA1|nr:nucleotidyltransferase domain-containing protein [Alkalihalobacillus sp. MEB130]MDT8859728.1 nucleotidyltransferase domain-containing protein [Alkalihalobacillus sp. MEB130]